jgi:hypothetical protein
MVQGKAWVPTFVGMTIRGLRRFSSKVDWYNQLSACIAAVTGRSYVTIKTYSFRAAIVPAWRAALRVSQELAHHAAGAGERGLNQGAVT